jgi:hypothetical protein
MLERSYLLSDPRPFEAQVNMTEVGWRMTEDFANEFIDIRSKSRINNVPFA